MDFQKFANRTLIRRAAACVLISGLFAAHGANAFPVDPAKVPVTGVDLSGLKSEYTLAYDSDDQSVVYYAPKTGRVALFNGMPEFGFATMNNGSGILNAQFEFVIQPSDRDALLSAIRRAGYSPVPLPFTKTKIMPMLPGWDPQTGQLTCPEAADPETGALKKYCVDSAYTSLAYVPSGPTLGENIAISAQLSRSGAAAMGALLRGGSAVQVGLQAEYYAAGDAFTAVVEVNYEKLYESFSAYVGFKGWLTQADLEGYWQKQALCPGRASSDCSVRIHLTDSRGRPLDNVTVDPDSPDAKLMYEAVEKLQQKLQDQMLEPITPVLGRADSSTPSFGWKVSTKFQHLTQEVHAQFEFKSTRPVITKTTMIVATAACLIVDPQGNVSFNRAGECAHYWDQ